MNVKKELIIILILASLLMSAVAGAFYFYKKSESAYAQSVQNVSVYVAAHTIAEGTVIEKEHLKQVTMAKQYLLVKPLLKEEIIGKIALENIYQNDLFRKEKIGIEKKQKEISIIDPFKKSSYNLAFRFFRNPNYSLKKGDYINIISVYPISAPTNQSPFQVQYVEKSVKILGFLRDGVESDKVIEKMKVTKTVKNKQITEEQDVKADEIILDIDKKVILSLIDDFNRGNQLWMVKTSGDFKNQKITKPDPIIEMIKKEQPQIERIEVFPYKIYTPSKQKTTLKATIHYMDKENPSAVATQKVVSDKSDICKQTNTFLLGVSKRVYLRSIPARDGRIISIAKRNYIIPYSKKINNSWYEVCDGTYVHVNETQEISKDFAYQKLRWK